MAYTNIWDETAPLDTSLASLLGQDIRTFKTDIRERVEQMSGTLANRPTPEAIWGRLLYFSIDTSQIFQWSGTAWADITSFYVTPPSLLNVNNLSTPLSGSVNLFSFSPPVGQKQVRVNIWSEFTSGALPTDVSLWLGSFRISPMFNPSAVSVSTLYMNYMVVDMGGGSIWTWDSGIIGKLTNTNLYNSPPTFIHNTGMPALGGTSLYVQMSGLVNTQVIITWTVTQG